MGAPAQAQNNTQPGEAEASARRRRGAVLAWGVAIAAFVVFWQFGKPLAAWAFKYPKAYAIPAQAWISSGMKWLLNEATFGLFTFLDLTRFTAAMIDIPTSSRSACCRPASCRGRDRARCSCCRRFRGSR